MQHRRLRSSLRSSTANLRAEMLVRLMVTGMLVVGLGQGVAQAQPVAEQPAVVQSADGKLLSPWVEKRVCPTRGDTTCRNVIVDPATREIAKLDNRWTSKFEATGNGLEVRRAESARDKAAKRKSSG